MDWKNLRNRVKQLRILGDQIITVNNAEWYSLFKDEIRNSIAIEGVFTNRQELIDVLEHNKKTNKQKSASILGYYEAASSMYEYANNQFKENDFMLRMADIKQMHTMLMRYEKDAGTFIGDIGEFRKMNVEVAHSTFIPINHFYIRPTMDLMIKWLNKNLKKSKNNPIELAAIIHVWFETIHPFRDGNGRVGRILLNYILIGSGLLNVSIKGVSKDNRSLYYDALEQADGGFERLHRETEKGKIIRISDVDKYFLEKHFQKFTEIIYHLQEESIKCVQNIQPININQEVILPLRDMARLYNYSQDYLRNLINRGQLKAKKRGKLWYVRVEDMAKYLDRIEKMK